METKVINKVKVKEIKPPIEYVEDPRPLKGAELFPKEYGNIFCVAKKRSGKTTVIGTILSQIATRESTVIIFASTVDKDKNYMGIRESLFKKGIPCVTFTSMFKDDSKVNMLEEWVHNEERRIEEEEGEDEDGEEAPPSTCVCFGDEEDPEGAGEEVEKKPAKCKYKSSDYIFVFDDLSHELKSSFLASYLKKNRHFKTTNIISSQYVKDIKPEVWRQVDYLITFGNVPVKQLEKLHIESNTHLDFDKFKEAYDYATKDPHNFLYMDTTTGQLRKNFNEEIIV